MLFHSFWSFVNNFRSLIDKDAKFLQDVQRNDVEEVLFYVNDHNSKMEIALETAALNNNRKMVLILLKKSGSNCSGVLMEQLLAHGNYEIADLFIKKDRWWGTAFEKYQNRKKIDQNKYIKDS